MKSFYLEQLNVGFSGGEKEKRNTSNETGTKVGYFR